MPGDAASVAQAAVARAKAVMNPNLNRLLIPVVVAGETPALLEQHFLDRRGYPALVVRKRHPPAVLLQVLAGIAHDNRYAGELKHLDIVVIVTDGHDLFPYQA